MYQLPLRYVKVSDDLAICATRIVTIMSVRAHQAREILHRERQNKTLLNACGKAAAQSVIILDNGAVISSPKTVNVLLRLVESSNRRFAVATANRLLRMKVTDVADEEPATPEEADGLDEAPEIQVELGEDGAEMGDEP